MDAVQKVSRFDDLKYIYLVSASTTPIEIFDVEKIPTKKVKMSEAEKTVSNLSDIHKREDLTDEQKEDKLATLRKHTRQLEELWITIVQSSLRNNCNVLLLHSNDNIDKEEIKNRLSQKEEEEIKKAIIY